MAAVSYFTRVDGGFSSQTTTPLLGGDGFGGGGGGEGNSGGGADEKVEGWTETKSPALVPSSRWSEPPTEFLKQNGVGLKV